MAKVSVIVTVLNEEKTIQSLINALLGQTRKADEIIIVDGGSTDSTWKVLNNQASRIKNQLMVYQRIGNRSVGRNFGVNKSKSPIIAFTDAGCIPHTDWLEELIKPFAQDAEVVSGYYEGKAENIFQKCLIPYVLVMPDQIPGEFWPSTRSMAMRRNVGLFDERLAHNEDYAFVYRLNRQGMKFVFARAAMVSWVPRKNLREAAWMFLRFAIGDAQAGILRPKIKWLAIRYYVFCFLLFINIWALVLIIPYIAWAIGKNYRYVKDLRALFWLPVLQFTADIMVLFGTVVGLLSRL